MAQKKKASTKSRSKQVRKKTKSQHPLKKASRLFLPYPIFLFVMLSVGAILIYSTFKASATDYNVNAKVPAPTLTDPAVIASPVAGTVFSAVPITVSGTCPLDSYVNIYRNNFFSGSTLCTASQTFELSTDLFEGANEITARVFNLTDDEGPSSPGVTVTYTPPRPVAEPGTTPEPNPTKPSTPSAGVSASPFVLKTDFKLRGYYAGQEVRVKLEAAGGSPPYAVNIDWGDGQTSLYSQKEAGIFSMSHVYQNPGGEKGNYNIKISGSDSDGTKTFMQLFVIVNAKDIPYPILGSGGDSKSPLSYLSDGFLKFMWPAYFVIALMAISFWLGEREELIELRRHASGQKRRA